jgi:hypothetical protein
MDLHGLLQGQLYLYFFLNIRNVVPSSSLFDYKSNVKVKQLHVSPALPQRNIPLY